MYSLPLLQSDGLPPSSSSILSTYNNLIAVLPGRTLQTNVISQLVIISINQLTENLFYFYGKGSLHSRSHGCCVLEVPDRGMPQGKNMHMVTTDRGMAKAATLQLLNPVNIVASSTFSETAV